MRAPPWLLVVALASGCAGRFPPCPAAGGPVWRELSSAHFRLRTDEDRERALATLAALEELRAVMLTCLSTGADLPTGRVPVIAVDDGWGELARAEIGGWFTKALFQPLVALRGGSDLEQELIIKHELAHYFSDLVIPHQPRWYAEGLATFLETIEYDADKHEITVGRPPLDRLRAVQRASPLDTKEMVEATTVGPEGSLFYPTAWLMMHFLMNHRGTGLVAYNEALRRGNTGSAAFWQAFPGLTAAGFDDELRNYLDGGHYTVLVFSFKSPITEIVEEHVLADADVHATRALLLAISGHDRSLHVTDAHAREAAVRAGQEASEALREVPAHVLGQAVEHWLLDGRPELERTREASREHPNDWLAWMLLAAALKQRGSTGDELGAALARARALAGADVSITLGQAAGFAH